MGRIKTSWAILQQSLAVLGQHRKLVLFPLINLVGMIGIIVFFALPLIFETSVFSLSEDLPIIQERMHEIAEQRQETRAESSDGEHVFFGNVEEEESFRAPFLPMMVIYLLSMFLLTYINVAFYHEILQAFNGNAVLIGRGLRFAGTKLKAIFMWSLLAGLIGTLIRQVEENVGFVGRWIMGLVGFAWSVASVFAIPVIIREQQQENPVAYLKTSAGIIKNTWGEGLTGVVSISIVIFLLFLLVIPVSIMLMIMMPFLIIYTMIATFLVIFILGYLSAVLKDIFLCGLYVYATEGVTPGAFEADLLDNAWKVKKSKKKKADDD